VQIDGSPFQQSGRKSVGPMRVTRRNPIFLTMVKTGFRRRVRQESKTMIFDT
jgi:hypothetical protein